MTLYALDGVAPTLSDTGDCWIAPDAVLIGNVTLGPRATVWFKSVLRGDNEPITLGAGCNVQDACVLHTDPGFPLTLADNVSVGHSAVLHGCTVGEGTLIGMGAMVLNGARIGKGCLIGARALITEGKEIPDHSMVIGAPGKVVKVLEEARVAALLNTAASYEARRLRYRAGLVEI